MNTAKFWARVQKAGADECWLWTGVKDRKGYGRFSVHYPVIRFAHRLSYAITNGPIPDGMVVCHRCDTPACVNPAHLFLGTHADNVRDRNEKGRQCRGERHQSAKLNINQVRAIRNSGEPHTILATRYGVHAQSIADIRKLRTWKTA
jgi:hypothetical protein